MTVHVHVFETAEDQARGLQFMSPIDPDTIYVFPVVPEGTEFHSVNVREPFDIAFLTEDYFTLLVARMAPEADRIRAPKGSALAVEARAGNLPKWGFRPGRGVATISP